MACAYLHRRKHANTHNIGLQEAVSLEQSQQAEPFPPASRNAASACERGRFSCTRPLLLAPRPRVSIQPYYPGMNYGVGAGMRAALANKLPPPASISPRRRAPAASSDKRRDYLERSLFMFAELLAAGVRLNKRSVGSAR